MKDFLRLIRFDKPIGTLLLLWPTLWALFIATKGHPPVIITMVFILGVFLTRSAGCAINDYADVEFDSKVSRTKNRPIVANKITKKQAILVCLILSLIAFILAWIFLTPNTLLLSIPALFIFLTYPFIKRFFSLPQMYLGIAFSFGILMVFMEVDSAISLNGVILFLANCFWVFGYDTIYAMSDLDDDLKTNIKTSAKTLGGYVVQAVMYSYMLFIGCVSILAYRLNFNIYFWLLFLVVCFLLIYQIIVISKSHKDTYFKMFLLNNRVGYLLLLAIILGR